MNRWYVYDPEAAAARRQRARDRIATGSRLAPPPEPTPDKPKPKRKVKPLTPEQVARRYNRLVRQVERAAKDAVKEQGEDRLSMDDACHDIGLSLAMNERPQVRAAFFQGYLGWNPVGDADLYRREHTDPTLAMPEAWWG